MSCGAAPAEPDPHRAPAAQGSPGDDAASGAPPAPSPGEHTEPRLKLGERQFPLLIASAAIVQRNYVDRGRFSPLRQLRTAMTYLGDEVPAFFGEMDADTLKVTVGSAARDFSLETVTGPKLAADLLEQVLIFTHDVLDLPLADRRELEYAAINGFLARLDPHTLLLTPDEHTDLGVRTRGHYAGVGAEIVARARRIAIVRVLPDSPAEAAGLLPGDLILEIDGRSTVNLSASDAMHLVRGPTGSQLRMVIRRAKKRLQFLVTRQVIRIDSVRPAQLPHDVAYIGLTHFQEDTAANVERALRSMQERAPLAGLILDLRGNPGGLLGQATALLDLLVDSGELVIVHASSGREAQNATASRVLGPQTPVVALIDEGSASAAEIVGGAIKHLERGIVIGRASFGKGTVQKVVPIGLYDKEVALKYTVAEYRIAGERRVQGTGVAPDVRLSPVRISSFVGVAQYYDEERFERGRERFHTARLPSAVHDHGAATFLGRPGPRLRYLEPPPQQSAPANEGQGLLRDAELRLAHSLVLSLVGTTTRDQQLEKLPAILATLNQEEDQKIAAAWGKQGIDWQNAPPDTPGPTLALAATLNSSGRAKGSAKTKSDRIQAGHPFTLELTATNAGTTPAYRTHAITDCPYDELDGIEIMFGYLLPGASITREIQLQVMPWHPDFHDQLSVRLHAGPPEGKPRASARIELSVSGTPRPQLQFDYWIVDDAQLAKTAPRRTPGPHVSDEPPFRVQGNGDGLLSPGEHVLIAFRVENRGPGSSDDTRAMVRNLSGQQGLLEEGLVELGKLQPGQSKTGAFGLTIAADATPRRPLELILTMADAHLRHRTDKKIALRVVRERQGYQAARSSARVGAEAVRIYNAADGSADVVARAQPGQRLAIVGRAGAWVGLSIPRGRRVWAPADLLAFDKPTRSAPPLALDILVSAPTIRLQPPPQRVQTDSITLHGECTHRVRVRNMVVHVQPSGPSSRARKVFFLANPDHPHPGSDRLAFDVNVPLEPGGNRITVSARNGHDVVARQVLWVHRHRPPR
ncbi:MAG: MXAN_5808 family serine peptidase [Nannocystaceae bacterium]